MRAFSFPSEWMLIPTSCTPTTKLSPALCVHHGSFFFKVFPLRFICSPKLASLDGKPHDSTP
eukprot:scaffold2195_cov333-Pavlova_lutheri.AAC.1